MLGVVQHLHLRYGDQHAMTLITFQDGKPVMRDGKVGTGQGCCCGGCGRCLVDGQVNHDYRTQAECERCRQCVEMLQTECNGDCPNGALPGESLVTLEFSSEECGTGGAGSVEIGCGTILSATVTNGGSGYATATFAEPTLTLSVSGGTGGVLTIDGYNKLSAGSDAYYGIGSVTVANGGSGYTDNAQATITLGTGDEKLPSSATPDIRIRTEYRPPNDEWTLQQYENGEPIPTVGTGLVISLTLVPTYAGATDYEASAVTVVAGGSGHSVGESFTAAAVEGGTVTEAALEITSVGSGGEVTGIALLASGQFLGIDTGVIDRVEFGLGGWRGAYRKATVSVCEVAVSIVQESPSNGTGATITATVETAAGANFGKVTGLTVTNGGSGYVALCEKKTTVASCDECPPRESPESATCEETGGCPCGAWVVDDNQEPCECCQWTLSPYGVGFTPSESNSQELNDCICNTFNQAFEDMGAAFEEAGWTVTLGPPPDGQQCGGSITAVCEECERAFPDPISADYGGFSRVPCNPDHWVDMPSFSLGTACGTLAFFGYPSLACVKGGQIVPGELYGLNRYYAADGKFYIPKCGQRITECKCCQRIVQNTGLILEEFDSACCGDCPQGYGPQWTDQYGNLWPTEWVCASGRCNPLP